MAFRPNYRHVDDAEAALENPSPLDRAKEAQSALEREVQEAAAFDRFFRNHKDEICANTANEICLRNFIGEGVFIDLPILEDALKIMRDQEHFPLSRVTDGMKSRHREELIQAILDEGPDSSNSESIRLNRASTEVLEQKIADIREEKRLRSMPIEELRRLAREDQERKHPKPTTPILPSKFSREILLAMSAPALRLLAGQYSMDRITERINNVN